MRRCVLLLIPCLAILMVTSCGQDTLLNPDPSPTLGINDSSAQAIAHRVAIAFGWEVGEDIQTGETAMGKVAPIDFQREIIAGDVVHYSFKIATGNGAYDYIGIHRVVREENEGRPIRTNKSVFLQHGDIKNFVGMYLPGKTSPSTSDDFGIAVFLARNDVDVWGIDQAWTLVPAEETDFGFMAGWGLDRQVSDLASALRVARHSRVAGGGGLDQMILSGYSSGSATGYAFINEETQLPPGRRQVKGYIPVDYAPFDSDPAWTEFACGELAYFQDLIAGGTYQSDSPFPLMSSLARDDPDGPSPVIPGFTNLQAALFLGTGPIFGIGSIHYLAGEWDGEVPVGLQYLSTDLWLDFMASGPPYEALAFMRDYDLWSCGDVDVPWDDHFSEVQIPVLNVATAGGIGPYSLYAPTMLGSSDVSTLWVQLRSEEERLLDFAHIDAFIAYNAEALVWEPMLQWIEDHSDKAAPPHGGGNKETVSD